MGSFRNADIEPQTRSRRRGSFTLNMLLTLKDEKTNLSGILAKSGPLDFAIKNSFPLFFVCEKGLVHMYQNHFIYFPILYFRFATSQKPILPATGFGGDQKTEIYGF